MASGTNIRFGIVPGLADLAKTLAGAFGRAKEREHQTALAGIRAQGQSRKAAAAALPTTKGLGTLTRRAKQADIDRGIAGDVPAGTISRRDEFSLKDPSSLPTLVNQQFEGFLPDPEASPEDRILNLLEKNQRGETLTEDEASALGQIQEVDGLSQELEKVGEGATKFGEAGLPIIGGVQFMQSGLQDGSITPARANMTFAADDGTQLPSMNQLLQNANRAARDPGNVAESQQELTDLQNMQNPTPTDTARIDELQRVTADPQFDEMHEIEAAFSQVAALNEQWNQDVQIINEEPADVISQMAGRELNPEERRAINATVFQNDKRIEGQTQPGQSQQAVREQSQFRMDMGQHLADGGTIASGMDQIKGANAGREYRAQTLAQVSPKFAKSPNLQNLATRFTEQALKRGLPPAQSEFVGQAFAVTQLPADLITRLARLDSASADVFLTQLENGVVGAAGGKFTATEEQIFELAQLYELNGLGKSGASASSQQVTDQIFQAFPNFTQPAPEQTSPRADLGQGGF